MPLICSIRPRLGALILLFCYASLAICFHSLSIMCASLPSARHMNKSHFPSHCIPVTSKQSTRRRRRPNSQSWICERGGGEIKAADGYSGAADYLIKRVRDILNMWVLEQIRCLSWFYLGATAAAGGGISADFQRYSPNDGCLSAEVAAGVDEQLVEPLWRGTLSPSATSGQ